MPMKAALYLRVSTLEQNAEAQRRELGAYAARHGWSVAEVFEDRASGAERQRPALEELLAAARAGKIDCVLCWKLDRFGRSAINLHENLQVLENEGVRFIVPGQGIDTEQNNPASRFLMNILAAVAELEREIIRERVASGMTRYRQDWQAGRVGRTVHSRSGKDLPPHRPRKVLDHSRIAALRAQGCSWAAIGRAVGCNAATAYRRYAQMGVAKGSQENNASNG